MIDKETAIELAMQTGYNSEGMTDFVHRLCNLAVRHAQKDAEPVAWIAKQEGGGLLLWDASYKHIQEGYDLGFNKSKRIKYYPLYLHPAHDDTALLRMALEALENMTEGPRQRAITALRERLGEVK